MPPDLAELKGTAHLQLAGYYGMVKRLDECLGRLQDALRSLPGLEDNTILMQTCEYAPTTARPVLSVVCAVRDFSAACARLSLLFAPRCPAF